MPRPTSLLVSDPAALTLSVDGTRLAIEMGVEGMHCNGCVESVTRALSEVEGVRDAEVRLEEGAATVRGRNPRLVYAAISGHGHSGPKAGRGGYDVIAQGEAGLMAAICTGDDCGRHGTWRSPFSGCHVWSGRHI